MGHNSVVSGHSKSKGIPRVDEVVNGTLGFGVSHLYIPTLLFQKKNPITLTIQKRN